MPRKAKQEIVEEPEDTSSDSASENESGSEYGSENEEIFSEGDIEEEDNEEDSEEDSDDDDDDDEFEDQGSSDDEDLLEEQAIESDDEDDNEKDDLGDARQVAVHAAEKSTRNWTVGRERALELQKAKAAGSLNVQQFLHIDDLSSDDEEAEGNTIGRVPLHWYDAYDHIGYDVSGQKIVKQAKRDRLDVAIDNKDNASSNRTVYDMYNDRDVVLSERDLEIIRRLQSGAFAHPEHNDTPDYIDYFSGIKEEMPIMAAPEPKRRFTPSKWEMMRVMKIVKAMKEGRYVSEKDKLAEKKNKPPVYMIWNDTEDEVLAESRRYRFHLPAPKIPLPGHAESYNPPAEYLLSEEEKKAMEDQDPTERQYNFIPKTHTCLRHVDGYDNFIKERFERCLDLYLCPRKMKRRLNIDPETLVPRLPKPRELRPFPNDLCLQYLGHTKAVTSIDVSPDGQYLISGSNDGTVRLWEVDTSLCRQCWKLGEAVSCVSWNPNSAHHLVSAVSGNKVVLIATGTGDRDSSDVLESFLTSSAACIAAGETESDDDSEEEGEEEQEDNEQTTVKENPLASAKWNAIVPKKREIVDKVHEYVIGPRLELVFGAPVTFATWHYRGDYLAATVPTGGAKSVSVHQISKGKSQYPFKKKSPGSVQCISFHPTRPFLFVATQQHVKVYNLVEQKMVKRLLSGCKWISSLDVHPSGDHVIIGSYDRRVVWFDLDLASTPYKTLKFHEKAVRGVKYHRRFPLMASAADDGTVHIFHSTVYKYVHPSFLPSFSRVLLLSYSYVIAWWMSCCFCVVMCK